MNDDSAILYILFVLPTTKKIWNHQYGNDFDKNKG